MNCLLVVFVTCLVLCSSLVYGLTLDFDYCCLDCITKSYKHIACSAGLPKTPSECRSFAQMAEEDLYTIRSDTPDTSLPPTDTSTSTTNSTIETTSINGTVDESTTTSATPDNSTAKPGGYRFKRSLETWGSYKDYIRTRVDEDEVIDAINAVRRNWVTNVSVSNMEEMVFDDELDDIADALARRCNSVKEFCADTPGFEVNVLTYNITLDMESNLTAKSVLDSWSKGEQELLTKAKTDNIYRRSDNNTDSFSILVWATTSRMGCADAISHRLNTKLNKNETTYQITCLIGPAGNKMGEPMWGKGMPCSACPPGTVCDAYGKLCSRPKPKEFPLDRQRASRCVQKGQGFPTYDDERQAQGDGRFRDFDTGIKVVLKPRKICDPISSPGTKAISLTSYLIFVYYSL